MARGAARRKAPVRMDLREGMVTVFFVFFVRGVLWVYQRIGCRVHGVRPEPAVFTPVGSRLGLWEIGRRGRRS